MTPIDQALAALAEPRRRALVERLRGGEQRPSELADALALSRPAVSRHLKVLRDAGLVEERIAPGDARERLVRLQPRALAPLQAWLEDLAAMWDDQLESFAAHVEERHRER
ncbi:MAG: metalloregulator ArsR/SmtB family transcription factor [Myxococcota bacterium]